MSVVRYAAGAAVPDYILDVEPLEPSGPRPEIVFAAECIVADAGDRYLIAVADADWRGPCLTIKEGDLSGAVTIFAATKDVSLVLGVQHFVYGGGGGGEAIEPVKPRPVPA